jgi:GNAT superfamily N-acetyltransferase
MMLTMAELEYVCRRSVPSDRPAILALCRSSLGWSPEDPDEAFFAWKHDENPFGQSPTWVAEGPGGTLIGLRVFLRWCFRDERGDAVSAVRAVDTATHPDWRGKGIFSTLTLGALSALREDGVDLVFNTPNGSSLPGYLKMGWSQVGKVPVVARLASLRSLGRLRTARTAANIWSEPIDVGEPAAEVLADHRAVEALLTRACTARRLATDRTPAFLSWRYRFEPLHYRAWRLGDALPDGVIIFRVRRRGRALEGTICDVVAPRGARLRRAFRHLAREAGADYLLASTASAGPSAGFIPAVGLGPVLAWKPINRSGTPAMADLGLVLGDIELF